jgi:hypothetical protein
MLAASPESDRPLGVARTRLADDGNAQRTTVSCLFHRLLAGKIKIAHRELEMKVNLQFISGKLINWVFMLFSYGPQIAI